MAINPVVRAALKALSYPDISIKKHYKLQRRLVDVTNLHLLKPLYTSFDHLIQVGDHQIPARIYTPELPGSEGALLFFHGGGWVTGNIDSYDRVCTDLARKTHRLVMSVDYRLAPEHRFPAALEDCYAAAREVFLHPEWVFAERAEDIALIGDSAGGNLAAAVSLMAKDRGEFMPTRQILIYPATYNDHTENSPFPSVRENGSDYLLTSKRVQEYMELYQGSEEDLQNPYFAPLLAEDLSGQPETLLITAQYDPLRDEGEEYGRRLAKVGVRVEAHRATDGLHGFFSLPASFEQVAECHRLIDRFLKEGPA